MYGKREGGMSVQRNFKFKENGHLITITGYVGKSLVVEIPAAINGRKVVAIGKECFLNAPITDVIFPPTITQIGAGAFCGCNQLEGVYLGGAQIKTIYKDAFKNCIALSEIELPGSLGVINAGTFEGCINLKSIRLPGGLTRICGDAFRDCMALERIETYQAIEGLPSGVNYIGKNAFENAPIAEDISSVLIKNTTKVGKLEDKKDHLTIKEKNYISIVQKNTGWDFETTIERMEEAKEKGIPYKYYIKSLYWQRNEKERNAYALRVKNSNNAEVRATYLDYISKATGWTSEEAKAAIKKANAACGCSYKDYYNFKLYELPEEKQQEYLTLGVWEAVFMKYNTNLKSLQSIDNKLLFNERFSPFLNRVWFSNKELTYESFVQNIKGLKGIMVKPAGGTQGKGIMKFDLTEEKDTRQIYDEIMSAPLSVIEEYLVQHKTMSEFAPDSVNTVRVMTLVDHGACHHIYAGFRTGRGGIVDNFHAGGVVATIDTTTGIVIHDAVDLQGEHYQTHPISGKQYRGFAVPNWDKVLATTREAAMTLDGFGLVGWDMAVTEGGVAIIEANAGPSHTIIQLPYVDDRVGQKYIVEPFLDI